MTKKLITSLGVCGVLMLGGLANAQEMRGSPGAGGGSGSSSYGGSSSPPSSYGSSGPAAGGYGGGGAGGNAGGAPITNDGGTDLSVTTSVDYPDGGGVVGGDSEQMPDTGGEPLLFSLSSMLAAGGAFLLRRKFQHKLQ